jgi:hypothetical protein
MAPKGIDQAFCDMDRAGFIAMKLDVTKYPIEVSPFGGIGAMVVAQNLTDLVHQFQFTHHGTRGGRLCAEYCAV